MTQPLNVRGSSITSKFAFVGEKFGTDEEKRFRAHFAGGEHYPVLDALWYPFEYYIEVCTRLANDYLDGDLANLREVGQFSAVRALSETYKAYTLSGDFTGFLSQISRLHSRFYSSGEMSVKVAPEGNFCEIRITGQGSYPLAEFYVAEGFYVGSAKHLGLRDVLSRFKRTDAGAVYQLKWTSREAADQVV